jgi:hypothetical protein
LGSFTIFSALINLIISGIPAVAACNIKIASAFFVIPPAALASASSSPSSASCFIVSTPTKRLPCPD